ncbi:hypothetical protein UE46_04160 [Listeria weihenstephanensis]|uniref:Uncharacterized protein n=1 Tax=Listeria weihenstephanensis TaxID=1006155 RepID=A0A1S7FSC1_9LIST|nr:hypothetical protein [Listeria weihenstephanensis]AQY50300.1 hypothetical protein UE46_04160 [Listeria weihenstephanensis]
MTKNRALLKLSDNVKLNKNKDLMAAEMTRTGDYYQKDVLEAFAAFIPENAVIYVMDSQFVSHAIYFSKYYHASKVYLFEKNHVTYKEVRNDAKRNKVVAIECLKPDWKKRRFHRMENGKAVTIQPEAPQLIHLGKQALEAGLIESLADRLDDSQTMLWLDTEALNFEEVGRLLEAKKYRVFQESGTNALYTFQEVAPEPEEDEHQLEMKILERLDTYKRQIDGLKQEYEGKLAIIQAEQDEKHVVLEAKYKAIAQKQAKVVKEHQQKSAQSAKETSEAKQLVQHMSDALNAERAVNYDLNKRIFTLLEDEKPVLLTMKKRHTQQVKEINNLKKENTVLTRKLATMTEKYTRLNDTKVIKMMRKYWKLKKSRRLRND